MSLFRAFGLARCKACLIVLGWFVVAILIPFRKTDESTRLPNGWVFTNFGTWFGNPFDGLVGDKRLDYLTELGLKEPTFYSMWYWAAVRNSVNYWSRLVAGCDVSRCTITKIFGQDVIEADKGYPGWQYLVAVRDDGRKYHRFFAEIPYKNSAHMFMIDIGWKIKLSHNGTPPDARPQDKFKGLVFTISPRKSL